MIGFQSDSFSWMNGADGMKLIISTTAAKQIAESRDPGKTYRVEIKEFCEKRSKTANAYAWVLIDKIAEKMRISKSEVYKSHIRDLGGNSETVCILEKSADKLCQCWQGNGLGWSTERFPSKIPGCVNVTLFVGSSAFDVPTMSRFIDNLIYDAKELGIETMTPAELARLEGYGVQ